MKVKFSNFFLKYSTFLIILFLSSLYFLFSILDSYRDVINPDSINWHVRSQAFYKGVSKGYFGHSYQVYHPGISLMWIMGYGVYSSGIPLDKDNFLANDYLSKKIIYSILTINFAISLYLLSKFLSKSSLLLFSAIIILEPFFLGVRRLVHLEALMVSFIFVSFLFLLNYSLRSPKYYFLILSSLFFVLGIYTKSSAIIILPILFIIFLLSKLSIISKIKHLFLTVLFLALFLYLLFPALWSDPIKSAPQMFQKIYQGASLIGYEGRIEVGTSGVGENRILNKSYSIDSDFYYNTLLYTLSPALWIIIISALVLCFYLFFQEIYKIRLNYKKYLDIFFTENFLISLITLFSFFLFYYSYSISVKSFERYAFAFFPFITLFVVSIINRFNQKLILITAIFYLALVSYDNYNIHPYYYAYGNTYLGGTHSRYEVLDSPPFGVGIYEVANFLSMYIKENETEFFPVVAGNKNLQAFFSNARNERYPFCDVDYAVVYAFDKQPNEVCVGRSYKKLHSIMIGNIDYWTIYKYNKRSTKIKPLNDKNRVNEEIPTSNE